MKNLVLMIIVVLLIIIDFVIMVELFNYDRNTGASILFILMSTIIIIAIVRSWTKTTKNYES